MITIPRQTRIEILRKVASAIEANGSEYRDSGNDENRSAIDNHGYDNQSPRAMFDDPGGSDISKNAGSQDADALFVEWCLSDL